MLVRHCEREGKWICLVIYEPDRRIKPDQPNGWNPHDGEKVVKISGVRVCLHADLLRSTKFLHRFLFHVSSVRKGLERSHLPSHDTLGWQCTNEFIHLIFRLGFNYEGSSKSVAGDASRTDLAFLSQPLKGWDNECVESLDRLLASCTEFRCLELDQIEDIHEVALPFVEHHIPPCATLPKC